MNKDATLHFRDQLRTARAAALRDVEAFQEIVFVFERLGSYLCQKQGSLGEYCERISAEAVNSPMAVDVPKDLPEYHQRFEVKYKLVRDARNAALHQGAFARHLTTNAIELSLVLEEAMMSELHQVGDFMVRDPVCAYLWQPLSLVRQTMLANSFSFLPVIDEREGKPGWRLVSDFRLGQFLRKNPQKKKEALVQSLGDTVASGQIKLHVARTCYAQDEIEKVLQNADGLPTLVLSKNDEDVLGIVTPFDLL